MDNISRANRLVAFLTRMHQWFQVWERELRRSGEEIMTLIGINNVQYNNNNCCIKSFNDNDKGTT